MVKKLLGAWLVTSTLCACSGGGASSNAMTPTQANSAAFSNADLVLTVAPSTVPTTPRAAPVPSPTLTATAAPIPKTARVNTPAPTGTP